MHAAVVILHPSEDTTIYSESDNSNALGALFAGTTPGSATRRALVGFDLVASGIPAGSIINSVSLDLVLTKIGPAATGPASFELNRLLGAWGEGSSIGSGTGGVATTGDATWNFRLFNSSSWAQPGGDFALTPSGTASIGIVTGSTYTFASQSGLVADVQSWLDNPSLNNGWILRASSESSVTAREFGSRESSVPQQPTLTVTYSPVPEPGTIALLGVATIIGAARRRR